MLKMQIQLLYFVSLLGFFLLLSILHSKTGNGKDFGSNINSIFLVFE